MERFIIKVYLLDDEESTLQWLLQNIQWDSYSCSVIGYDTQAEKALRFLGENQVDLLLTDVTMPNIDGLSLISRVKKVQKNLKVIVISAHDNFEFIKKALLLGVENYLLKPIDPKELHNTLQLVSEKIFNALTPASEPETLVFHNNLLQQWARNEFFESNFIEHAEMARLNLCCASYTAVAIRLDVPESKSICRLFEVCNRFYAQWNNYFFIDRSSDIIGILPEFQKGHLAIINRLYKQLADAADGKVFMMIGPAVHSYSKLSISYQVSTDYLSASMFLPYGIWKCDDFPYKQYHISVKDRETKGLKKLIQENNISSAIICADALLKQNPQFSLRNRAVALAIYILKVIRQPYSFSEDQRLDLQDFYSLSTKDEIMDWIHHLIRLVVRVNDKLDKQLNPYVSKALVYLRAHYEKPELTLQSIADSLNVNTAYLGQLFRTQTGKYFNDYLTDARLETACSLLTDSSFHIRKIAQMVGIPNQSYFNRVFKKKFMLTPMEYHQRYAEIREKN